MINRTALLTTAYWGPVQYYSKLYGYRRILIEQHDNYVKQTYRNRCQILGPNGVQNLTVPVQKGAALKTKTKDITIDNYKEWQKQHWRAIYSAYKSSPFFELFSESLKTFYTKTYTFLLDLNLDILKWSLDMLELPVVYRLTPQYNKVPEPNVDDYRDVIHPKVQFAKNDILFQSPFYYQVFWDKLGFYPNLSILDLLCMEGPNAPNLLEKSFGGG